MSKTKQNIPKSARGGYSLYARRPLSGYPLNSRNKRLCRRLERAKARRDTRKIKEIENFLMQLAPLISNLDDRLRVLEARKPVRVPSDAEIISMMEKLGEDWETCKEKLMRVK